MYDEPRQASNTTITDNPSYGVNERKNQGSKLKHYIEHYIILCYLCTGIRSDPLLYEEIMIN